MITRWWGQITLINNCNILSLAVVQFTALSQQSKWTPISINILSLMTASLSQCQGGNSTVGYLDYNVKQIILHIELQFFYMISHLVPRREEIWRGSCESCQLLGGWAAAARLYTADCQIKMICCSALARDPQFVHKILKRLSLSAQYSDTLVPEKSIHYVAQFLASADLNCACARFCYSVSPWVTFQKF